MCDTSGLLAHYDRGNQKEQLLIDHLSNTANIASNIGKDIGIGNFSFLLGALHDIGKADIKFQTMLQDMSYDERVIHSTAGAYFLFEKGYNKNFQGEEISQNYNDFIETCMYVIEAHHGIFDIIGPSDNLRENSLQSSAPVNKIFERVEKYKADGSYNKELIENFVNKDVEVMIQGNLSLDSIDELIEAAFAEYNNVVQIFNKNYAPIKDGDDRQKNKHKREEKRFFDAMLMRLLLSILKFADVKDTINAYGLIIEDRTKNEILSLSEHYVEAIEAEYLKYNKHNENIKPINQVRNEIADVLMNRGQQDDESGIYRLNVPTGAGKTKAALRYALHQISHKSKNKFIYVTAFLSVLEQNAKEIKGIIGEDGVLEHHSNVDIFAGMPYGQSVDEKEVPEYVQKSFMVDTWEDSVVLTTMVQFFNTLFKGRSANLRRFSSLINSVIVIDEVQSLPIEVMYFFNLTMNFLKNVMNCTIVLCTATQPIYDHDSIKHKLQYGGSCGGRENADLIALSDKDRECFVRYSVRKFRDDEGGSHANIHVSAEEIAKFICDSRDKSTLIVVNTKAAARSIVESLDELDLPKSDVYYLTTNLCPAHRKKIISEIKERLSRGEKIICVSTQLIEAGVDVDFERVMRSYAGVDSIIQVAGRCNREARLPNAGEVILFNPDEATENTKGILGISDKKRIAEDLLAEMHGKIDIDNLGYSFYDSYYSDEAYGGNRMEYPLGRDRSTLFDFFVGNGIFARDIQDETGRMRGKLKEIAERFQLISDDTDGVFVYYEDGIDDLNHLLHIAEQKFISAKDRADMKRLLRKLQPYSLNVYKNNHLNEFVLSYLDGDIKVLHQDHYNERFGASKEIDTIII